MIHLDPPFYLPAVTTVVGQRGLEITQGYVLFAGGLIHGSPGFEIL